ncbi:hypothetical protein [Nocardioides bizhenqiangii]|uniref:DUF3040 domain-containing protein n=1 Tax=Nocardioides bizhenqiangii TaxID=3095076 RepID=A0ABZ0ZPA7_9ACTN|nr:MULTISPECIES: hypothetical protein [unclassified Nocardioides]MDZ5621559.1 hypothetical protein [Nocardioides sp. HM23]WQQ25604.1 hypothetical protein SHK19_16755 [Nocardioides sp. HM61]
MDEDELRAAPAIDTISLLVTAARRAGFDVDSDPLDQVAVDVGPRRTGWLHVRAMAVAGVAILAAAIGAESTSDGKAAVVASILVLMCASLADIYNGRPAAPRP